jgi:hypothetical protein
VSEDGFEDVEGDVRHGEMGREGWRRPWRVIGGKLVAVALDADGCYIDRANPLPIKRKPLPPNNRSMVGAMRN